MKLWWLYALLGAVAGGCMPVFVKRGLKLPDGTDMDSNLATAIRVVMLLLPVWILVWYTGKSGQMGQFTGKNWLFLALSAGATGLSWLFSFKALQYADAARVMPIDKFSLVVTVVLAALFLGESINVRLGVGVVLIVIGTLLAIDSKKSGGSGKDGGKEAPRKAAMAQPVGADEAAPTGS